MVSGIVLRVLGVSWVLLSEHGGPEFRVVAALRGAVFLWRGGSTDFGNSEVKDYGLWPNSGFHYARKNPTRAMRYETTSHAFCRGDNVNASRAHALGRKQGRTPERRLRLHVP